MSEVRLLACAMLLSGGVAAAVAAATMRIAAPEGPQVASVRLAEIAAAYTTRAAAEGRTSGDVRAWGTALEAALDRVAERHGAVLLPARAVAAGGARPHGGSRGNARGPSCARWNGAAGRGSVSAGRPIVELRAANPRRRNIGLAVMVALAALWLLAASRVHVNASWSDGAWGYAAFPLFGESPKVGDRVLFEPPPGIGSKVPYLKTVRGVPGMRIAVEEDGTVFLDGEPVARAKTHALDGRPLAAIAPGVIPRGLFYLHAGHIDSHDSRYAEIGLVPRDRILGRAVAMPDLPWLGLNGPLVGPEDTGPESDSTAILPHAHDGPPPVETAR